ncbi:hypothetical protein B479_01970 [Pseudomonas putida HB3267]|mgnify:CR=1 FL=1|nr:hypothetical protein B479_01970 [Pseudomonas putida HB3267]
MDAAEKLLAQLRDADREVEPYADKPGNKALQAVWDTCFT